MSQPFKQTKDHSILNSKDINESDHIKLMYMPTLHHMTAVKITSHLWTIKDISKEISKLFETRAAVSDKFFIRLSLLIEKEVSKLPFSRKIISHLTYVTSRLSIEIYQWICLQWKLDSDFDPCRYHYFIQWTSRGRIDYERTAELILSEDDISETYRAEASKYYCFNLHGEDLLNQAIANAELDADEAYSKNRVMPHGNQVNVFPGERNSYCLQTNQGKTEKKIQGPQFLYLANQVSEVALRRLWRTFTEETKVEILKNFTWNKIEKNGDLLCFFLSQMDAVSQMKFLQGHAYTVLRILFTDWIWQDYFIPIFTKVYPDIHDDICTLIYVMASAMKYDSHNSRNKIILTEMLNIIAPQNTLPMKEMTFTLIIRILVCLFSDENRDIISLLLSLIPHKEKAAFVDAMIHALGDFSNVRHISLIHLAIEQMFPKPK